MAPLIAAIFLLAAVSAEAPAQQQQPLIQTIEEHDNSRGEIDKREGGFVHRTSGYAYPASLGEMPARKTVTYGNADAAVYYTLYGGANGDPWIDLFVYPAQLSLNEEAGEVEGAIRQRLPKKVAAPSGLPDGPAGSLDGWYAGEIDGLALLSGYRLVRHGDWFIKVRVSIPTKGGDVAVARAMRGLAAVPWSLPERARSAAAVAVRHR